MNIEFIENEKTAESSVVTKSNKVTSTICQDHKERYIQVKKEPEWVDPSKTVYKLEDTEIEAPIDFQDLVDNEFPLSAYSLSNSQTKSSAQVNSIIDTNHETVKESTQIAIFKEEDSPIEG